MVNRPPGSERHVLCRRYRTGATPFHSPGQRSATALLDRFAPTGAHTWCTGSWNQFDV